MCRRPPVPDRRDAASSIFPSFNPASRSLPIVSNLTLISSQKASRELGSDVACEVAAERILPGESYEPGGRRAYLLPLSLTSSLSTAPARRRVAGFPSTYSSSSFRARAAAPNIPDFAPRGASLISTRSRRRVRPQPQLPTGELQHQISGLGDTTAYRDRLRVEHVH